MRKTMSKDATTGIRSIRTRNGVDTTTQPFYVKKIHHFTPRSDGYNEELAEYVFKQLKANQALWDQGVWRRLITADNIEGERYHAAEVWGMDYEDVTTDLLTKELQVALAFKDERENPICGTAMCAAGWVTEVMATDFLVDMKMAHWAYANGHDIETHLDSVLIAKSVIKGLRERRDAGERVHIPSTNGLNWMLEVTMHSALTNGVRELLAQRGFSDETHEITTIPDWAIHCLGLVGTDGPDIPMFAANNSIEKIRRHLDQYSQLGPDAHYLPEDDEDDEGEDD